MGCVTDLSGRSVTINFGNGPVSVPWDSIKQKDMQVGDVCTFDVHTWLLIREGVIS